MSNENQVVIEWTVPKGQRFKLAYKAAKNQQLESFMFEGHEFVTNYAKYLIDYLEHVFGEPF